MDANKLKPEDSAAMELARAEELERSGLGGIHFSAPFIKRPVATFLLSGAIILAGCVAYVMLPVSSLPQVEFPTISVNASLPGADPETMASSVATPLERQFSRIAGVTQMTSSSSMGSANINLQFDLDRDVNGAARDVAGCHQCGTQPVACEHAVESELSQSQPGGLADRDAGHDVRYDVGAAVI